MKKLSIIFLLLLHGFLNAQNPTPLEKLKNELNSLKQEFAMLEKFIAALPKVEPIIEPVEKSEEEKRREEAQKKKEEEETRKAEAEKRARELNEVGYSKVMGTYKQMISKLSEKPNAQELHDWLVQFKTSLPDVVKLLEQTGNQFYDLYEKKYSEFRDELPKFITLLENIVTDINNWFVTSNQHYLYKGNDVPEYQKHFTLQDYELFEKSLHEYKRLKERDNKLNEGTTFFKAHENRLAGYKKWIDLPPTITFDKKKYSSLETQIKNNLIDQVNEYRYVLSPSEQQKKTVKNLFEYITKIAYRNNEKDTLKSLASIYQKIVGTDLTWSQNFTDFDKKLKKDIKDSEEKYNRQKLIYQTIPLKERILENYKAMKEAFQELVKFRAPTSQELEFYANIGKEEEKIEEKIEEEEEEENEQLLEKLKKELEAIKGKLDFSLLTKKEIEGYIEKIQKYRKLSGNQTAYLREFTFLSQESKNK